MALVTTKTVVGRPKDAFEKEKKLTVFIAAFRRQGLSINADAILLLREVLQGQRDSFLGDLLSSIDKPSCTLMLSF